MKRKLQNIRSYQYSIALLVMVCFNFHKLQAQMYNPWLFFYNPNSIVSGFKMDFRTYPYVIDSIAMYWKVPLMNHGDPHNADGIICDSNGNIRFYSDYYRIWNKKHTLFNKKNDSSEFNLNFCSESSLMVPKPGNDSIVYYLNFGNYCFNQFLGNILMPYSMELFTVNEKKDSGRGGMVERYKIIDDFIRPYGLLMQHRNKKDYWMVVKRANTVEYLSYPINDTIGFDSVNIISSPISPYSTVNYLTNYPATFMKSNIKGDRVVSMFSDYKVLEVCNFNNSSGELSTPRSIKMLSAYAYFEISPNGRWLYVNPLYNIKSQSVSDRYIYIYDLDQTTDSAIEASVIKYDTKITSKTMYDLQLMSDCRIHILDYNGYWNAIDYPNEDTAHFNFHQTSMFFHPAIYDFQYGGRLTSPPAFSIIPKDKKRNSLSAKVTCADDSTALTLKTCSPGIYQWYFGDGDSATSRDSGVVAKHVYKQVGNYTAKVTIKNPCGLDTVYANVTITAKPTFTIGNDTIICERGQPLIVKGNLTNYQYTWSTKDTTSSITTNKSGTYSVKATNGICKFYDTITIVRQKPPIVSLYTSYYKCPEDSVWLDAKNPQASILWSNGDTAHTTGFIVEGKNQVAVTEGVCTTIDSFTINNYGVKKPKVLKLAADSIFVSSQYKKYQWYKNNILLANDTNHLLKLLTPANYYCKAWDMNGCATTSDTVSINLGLSGIEANNTMKIYPNPTKGLFTLSLSESSKGLIQLYDINGKKVYEKQIYEKLCSFDISQLPSATYIVKVITEKEEMILKVVKE
ncbi:MAG: T9SS type A sorting domain-containing protein [Bacteroidetes bacterium]|nr:T9SS type A sorting domain-containing protein [Bacteroidota bacterium]